MRVNIIFSFEIDGVRMKSYSTDDKDYDETMSMINNHNCDEIDCDDCCCFLPDDDCKIFKGSIFPNWTNIEKIYIDRCKFNGTM